MSYRTWAGARLRGRGAQGLTTSGGAETARSECPWLVSSSSEWAAALPTDSSTRPHLRRPRSPPPRADHGPRVRGGHRGGGRGGERPTGDRHGSTARPRRPREAAANRPQSRVRAARDPVSPPLRARKAVGTLRPMGMSSTRSCAPVRAGSSRPSPGWSPRSTRSSPRCEALTDDALRAKTGEFRTSGSTTARTSTTSSSRPSPWSGRRPGAIIGQRHYDVQLMGGAALHFGWVAEMKTGEGKTLVSTLPVYLNALTGKGVHLITVNDYLAKRDAEWMGQVHRWLGLDVGLVIPEIDDLRREARAYACRHHLRHQQRVRLRLPARQHGHVAATTRSSGATPTPSSTRSTRSSSTRPARRSSSAAGSPTPPSSTTASPASCGASARRRLRGRRGEAHRAPHRGRRREGRAALGRREPLRRASLQNLVHQLQAALRPRSCSSATRTTSSSTAR